MNRVLKSLRVKNGDTQQDLARFLGITISTFNLKENGKCPFTLNEAFKISKKYKLNIEEIFLKTNAS